MACQPQGGVLLSNNNYTPTIFIVLSNAAKPYARLHSGHLSESWSARGGRKLV